MNKPIKVFGKNVTVSFFKYKNKTVCLSLERNGEPFLTASVNYEEFWEGGMPYKKAFPFPCVVLKNYAENEGIIKELVEAGVINKGGAYLSGSGGTVEVRTINESWIEYAKQQISKL